ncbi:hypothetical protein I5G63_gp066 [Mycobacterium phage Imvubu]|uniref:Uncharacterized protein n=1 Tax=Mycobacterium phage Imvubu TaxID=2686233 RepID=A0A6B9L7H8_9CAUD|nr:hypothetical protein I5G63_gp066 [Mycobacterium phage Imvubu]QHB37807.1 hypothetical protein PBI_IMVUBU_66 [Mycobacterium phage Imvubu]
MTAVGTLCPELGADERDGTVWADVNLALWSPIPDQWGGGWVVVMREPFSITQCHMAQATREFGPYVAVLEPPNTEEAQDGGGLRGD